MKIPLQPSPTGHNILKQIIHSCLVNSPRDISLTIFHPKLIIFLTQDEKEAFPINLKVYFQHLSILSITNILSSPKVLNIHIWPIAHHQAGTIHGHQRAEINYIFEQNHGVCSEHKQLMNYLISNFF